MESEYIIETNGTVRECLQRCLDANEEPPLTLKEVIQAKKDGKIPKDKWYDTSTIQFKDGTQKDATEQELRDLLSGKLRGALFVTCIGSSSYANGDDLLYIDGSFVRRSSPIVKKQGDAVKSIASEESYNPSLKEVCQWWIKTYPKDVFIGKTKDSKEIVIIRKEMEKLLRKIK